MQELGQLGQCSWEDLLKDLHDAVAEGVDEAAQQQPTEQNPPPPQQPAQPNPQQPPPQQQPAPAWPLPQPQQTKAPKRAARRRPATPTDAAGQTTLDTFLLRLPPSQQTEQVEQQQRQQQQQPEEPQPQQPEEAQPLPPPQPQQPQQPDIKTAAAAAAIRREIAGLQVALGTEAQPDRAGGEQELLAKPSEQAAEQAAEQPPQPLEGGDDGGGKKRQRRSEAERLKPFAWDVRREAHPPNFEKFLPMTGQGQRKRQVRGCGRAGVGGHSQSVGLAAVLIFLPRAPPALAEEPRAARGDALQQHERHG